MKSRFLVVVLLAYGTAQASEWVSLGKSDSGSQHFLDVSSIRVAGPIRRAWIKTVLAPQSFREPTGPDANKWWRASIVRTAFNCNLEASRNEAITVYYEDGTNDSDPTQTEWRAVTPDTLLSAEMQFICAWKPK